MKQLAAAFLLFIGIVVPVLAAEPATVPTAQAGPRLADWLKEARIGAFMHFLPGDAAQFPKVNDFDVAALATQLDGIGAKYLVFTLGQNSGWFNAPNATYERISGYQTGERCARRDLPRYARISTH